MNWKKAGVVGKLGEINPEVPTTMQARIRIGKETVKELVAGLQKAYKSGDVKMVRRVSTLLDVSRADGIEVAAQTHGVSRSSVYAWLKQLMVEGVGHEGRNGTENPVKGSASETITWPGKRNLGCHKNESPEKR
jgi:hypothetical protein